MRTTKKHNFICNYQSRKAQSWRYESLMKFKPKPRSFKEIFIAPTKNMTEARWPKSTEIVKEPLPSPLSFFGTKSENSGSIYMYRQVNNLVKATLPQLMGGPYTT